MKWCHLWNTLEVSLSMEIRSFEETLNRWHNFPVIVVHITVYSKSNIVSDSKLSPIFNLCQACGLRTSRWGWGDSLFFFWFVFCRYVGLRKCKQSVSGTSHSLPIFGSNLPGTGTGAGMFGEGRRVHVLQFPTWPWWGRSPGHHYLVCFILLATGVFCWHAGAAGYGGDDFLGRV